LSDSRARDAGRELRLANGVTLLAKFDGEFAALSSAYAGTGNGAIHLVTTAVARMSAAKSGAILEGTDRGYRFAHPGYDTLARRTKFRRDGLDF
jgi:hypothetical protein